MLAYQLTLGSRLSLYPSVLELLECTTLPRILCVRARDPNSVFKLEGGDGNGRSQCVGGGNGGCCWAMLMVVEAVDTG